MPNTIDKADFNKVLSRFQGIKWPKDFPKIHFHGDPDPVRLKVVLEDAVSYAMADACEISVHDMSVVDRKTIEDALELLIPGAIEQKTREFKDKICFHPE